MCHSVNSDLVLGAHGPLGDSHVAVHICQTYSEDDISEEDVYALMAWPTKLIHCHGVSLHNHEMRDNFNRMQAALTKVPLSKSRRPYSSVNQNSPQDDPRKYRELFSKESINLVSSKVCCLKNCV